MVKVVFVVPQYLSIILRKVTRIVIVIVVVIVVRIVIRIRIGGVVGHEVWGVVG